MLVCLLLADSRPCSLITSSMGFSSPGSIIMQHTVADIVKIIELAGLNTPPKCKEGG
ncbi:MAG TPA: hypothetical protein PLX97_11325 [Gemmatales bacterium]|nr:hypothetical protein [Gemmatales bacterium]